MIPSGLVIVAIVALPLLIILIETVKSFVFKLNCSMHFLEFSFNDSSRFLMYSYYTVPSDGDGSSGYSET